MSGVGSRYVTVMVEIQQHEDKQTFRRLYIARFVERGLTAEAGAASFDAADFSDIDDMTPEQAADEELSYWSDDGDE